MRFKKLVSTNVMEVYAMGFCTCNRARSHAEVDIKSFAFSDFNLVRRGGYTICNLQGKSKAR